MDFETWKQLVLEDQARVRKVQMRAIIPPNKIGHIMGVKGAAQKKLCRKYEAKVLFAEVQNSSGALLTVDATCVSIGNVWREILNLMFTEESEKNNSQSISFLLCDDFIGFLNENNVLHDIAKESKTKIIIKCNNMPNSTEHVVQVVVKMVDDSHLNSFQRAAYLLSKQFELHPTFAYSMPGTKFYIASAKYREEAIKVLSNSDEQDIVFDFM